MGFSVSLCSLPAVQSLLVKTQRFPGGAEVIGNEMCAGATLLAVVLR